ncbi:MAG: DUF2813 domain-containing protein [Calditrichaeota bacterium]|nr:MAG: DUF2813 domain-containing protein [Calditrichota bacterium]
MHLESIEIDNFRGITQPSEVKGFNKLTVVVGPNNSGKSTLLESIYLGTVSPNNPHWTSDNELVLATDFILNRRGNLGDQKLISTFNPTKELTFATKFLNSKSHLKQFVNKSGNLEIYVSNPDENSLLDNLLNDLDELYDSESDFIKIFDGQSLYIYVSKNNFISKKGLDFDNKVHFVDTKELNETKELNAIFEKFEETYQTQKFVKLFSENTPSLKKLVDFRMRKPFKENGNQSNEYVVFATFEDYGHPAMHLGDGAKKLLQAFSTLQKCKDGICLLEEPEAFQHPKYSRLMIEFFEDAIYKNNTQVILCTHSLEFLDDILDIFQSSKIAKIDDVTILQTQLEDGKMSAYEYKGKRAIDVREKLGVDLRG